MRNTSYLLYSFQYDETSRFKIDKNGVFEISGDMVDEADGNRIISYGDDLEVNEEDFYKRNKEIDWKEWMDSCYQFSKEGPILLSTGRTKGDTGRMELKEELEKSIKEKTIR